MDIKQIKELMAHLEASKLAKLIYKKGDFELHLEKESSAVIPVRKVAAEVSVEPEATPHHSPKKEKAEESGVFVTSPMVGTYYASPAPDQAHFVKVGDKVHAGPVVCIIEAMKVMNEVKAGVSGTVAEILIHNGQPVEFGTRIFRIVN